MLNKLYDVDGNECLDDKIYGRMKLISKYGIETEVDISNVAIESFDNCDEVEKIVILEGIKEIPPVFWEKFSNLLEIKFPKGLESINFYLFKDNSNLRYLEMPIEIVDGIVYFNYYYENFFINKGPYKYRKGDFERYVSNKKSGGVTLLYEDINQLKKYLERFFWIKYIYLGHMLKDSYIFNKRFKLTLRGLELEPSQKKMIKKMLFDKKILNVDFESQELLEKDKFIIEVDGIDYDNRMLLNKIKILLEQLSGDIRNTILDRVNLEINKYKEKVKNEKPVLDFKKNDSFLNLEGNDVGNAKQILNIELNNIILTLSRQNNILELLSKLEEYKKILDMKVEKKPVESTIIEEVLYNIVYLASQVDINTKKEILDKTKAYLDETKEIYELELKGSFNSSFELRTLDPKQQLYFDLSNYFDEVRVDTKEIIRFTSLLNCLNSNEYSNNLENDSIISLINSTYNVILKIKNIDVSEQFNAKFNELKKMYINKIEKIISNGECSVEGYNKIEFEIRIDIQDFLKDLNDYSITGQVDSFILLTEALKFMDKNDGQFKYKESVEIVFIKDILNILNNDYFNEKEKEKTIEEIKKLLYNCIAELNGLKNKNEDKEIIKKLRNDLAGIVLQLKSYLLKKERYNKIYSINNYSIIELENKNVSNYKR